MSTLLILAARHHSASPEAQLLTLVVGVIGFIVAVIAALNKGQNANWKNGRPYCPCCGKQISLKLSRPSCRSCGYKLVQAPARPVQPPARPAMRIMIPAQPAEPDPTALAELSTRAALERQRHEEYLQRERARAEEASRLRKLRRQQFWKATGKPVLIGVGLVLVLALPLLLLAASLASK
jgi:hypothetical protein